MAKKNLTTAPADSNTIAWSSRLDVHHLGGETMAASGTAGDSGRRQQASKIEKEIIWAVVVLYAGLIACFAGLHLYGIALG